MDYQLNVKFKCNFYFTFMKHLAKNEYNIFFNCFLLSKYFGAEFILSEVNFF